MGRCSMVMSGADLDPPCPAFNLALLRSCSTPCDDNTAQSLAIHNGLTSKVLHLQRQLAEEDKLTFLHEQISVRAWMQQSLLRALQQSASGMMDTSARCRQLT